MKKAARDLADDGRPPAKGPRAGCWLGFALLSMLVILIGFTLLIRGLFVRPDSPVIYLTATPGGGQPLPTQQGQPTAEPLVFIEPTPNPTSSARAVSASQGVYVVKAGDTLGRIAQAHQTNVDHMLKLNPGIDKDNLSVGQQLTVPGSPGVLGPDQKLIPDSELVYSPGAKDFDVYAFVMQGYPESFLASYTETLEGVTWSGVDVVNYVAKQFSINPRLLLALLEHNAGWLTQTPAEIDRLYPLGEGAPSYEGLYKQLSWAANQLNAGYYGWRHHNLRAITFGDGTRVALAPTLNAGTAALQWMLSQNQVYSIWQDQVSRGETALFSTYTGLFGDPFKRAKEPLIAPDLKQPALSLPWDQTETWYLTGGPHGGWGSGSAWASLDFVPPGESVGCYDSEHWVRASAPGVIARSANGIVVLDLDGDGFEGTGWTVMYGHIATRDRIAVGTHVNAGDPLGHPSCEGGFSTGTHVHIARRYNGEWIPADCPGCLSEIPAPAFVMGNWRAESAGTGEYDGYLINGLIQREASVVRAEGNAITW